MEIEKADILLKEDHKIYVIGKITFDNVTSIVKKGLKIIDTVQYVTVDLTKIESADSSVLVLFTSLIKSAKSQHKEIILVNIPDCLLDLVRVSGLDEILPLRN